MKNFKKIKIYDKIEVFWVDSNHATGWTENKEYLNDKELSLNHKTCGYFLNENKRSINIVQSLQEYISKDETRMVDSLMQIPKVAIYKIKILK